MLLGYRATHVDQGHTNLATNLTVLT
jgi:hypothetical protein